MPENDQVGADSVGIGTAMGDEVSPIELLFDLVFVFAISQLSHHLLTTLSWRGALETVVLLLAVFGIWALVSFGASMPGISRRAEVAALFVVMILGLFFNAGLTSAFSDSPWLFVVPFLACSVGIALFYMLGARSAQMRRHGQSMLIWTLASTVLWMVGATAAAEPRLWWWLAAALLDLVGAWSAHRLPGHHFRTVEVPFSPWHMIERSRLFLIIALGETVLTTATALTNARLSVAVVAAALAAALGTVALWALYFAGSDRLVTEQASTTSDPLRAARLAVNGQVVPAAGLIALAVAFERTISEPSTPSSTTTLLLVAGSILYVGFQAWYLHALTGTPPFVRLIGIGTLLVSGLGATLLPAVGALAVTSAILAALAVVAVFRNRNTSTGS